MLKRLGSGRRPPRVRRAAGEQGASTPSEMAAGRHRRGRADGVPTRWRAPAPSSGRAAWSWSRARLSWSAPRVRLAARTCRPIRPIDPVRSSAHAVLRRRLQGGMGRGHERARCRRRARSASASTSAAPRPRSRRTEEGMVIRANAEDRALRRRWACSKRSWSGEGQPQAPGRAGARKWPQGHQPNSGEGERGHRNREGPADRQARQGLEDQAPGLDPGAAVRISGKKRDELQAMMQLLRARDDLELDLQFINFRD